MKSTRLLLAILTGLGAMTVTVAGGHGAGPIGYALLAIFSGEAGRNAVFWMVIMTLVFAPIGIMFISGFLRVRWNRLLLAGIACFWLLGLCGVAVLASEGRLFTLISSLPLLICMAGYVYAMSASDPGGHWVTPPDRRRLSPFAWFFAALGYPIGQALIGLALAILNKKLLLMLSNEGGLVIANIALILTVQTLFFAGYTVFILLKLDRVPDCGIRALNIAMVLAGVATALNVVFRIFGNMLAGGESGGFLIFFLSGMFQLFCLISVVIFITSLVLRYFKPGARKAAPTSLELPK